MRPSVCSSLLNRWTSQIGDATVKRLCTPSSRSHVLAFTPLLPGGPRTSSLSFASAGAVFSSLSVQRNGYSTSVSWAQLHFPVASCSSRVAQSNCLRCFSLTRHGSYSALLRLSRHGSGCSASSTGVFSASFLQARQSSTQSNAAGGDEKSDNNNKEEKTSSDASEDHEEPRLGFFQKVKEDMRIYPDIYNSLNGLHFVLFLVFCLVSTASTDEDNFWKSQLSVSDRVRPLSWLTHSIITENFMAMSYSMMMLHKTLVQMNSVWGLRKTQMFVLLTAGISGFVMWAGNYAYYQIHCRGKSEKKPEFQYGPWDVMYALLVAQYLHVAISPVRAILSFDHWLKYASAVGTLFIWYYDWQPTLVGAGVGLVLCKTVPAFKVMGAAKP